MADYKQMYFTLLDATEKAIETLISAQRAVEELYIHTAEEDEKRTPDGCSFFREKRFALRTEDALRQGSVSCGKATPAHRAPYINAS